MSENPITKLYVLDDNGDFIQIEPSTIAGAVTDETNNDTVQEFINDGVTDWEQGIKSDEQYPAARLVYETFDELNDKIEEWYKNSVRYKGTWDCTEQTDFLSIQLPVKMGYAYRVIGEETQIGDRKFQDGDLIIINRDIEKTEEITNNDVILLLGYGNEQAKINRCVIDTVPTYASLQTYNPGYEIQLNSVIIVANDERHNDSLSFYEYIEGYDYDISFDTYAEMIAYQGMPYVEGYEQTRDDVNHIITLDKYIGTLVDVSMPVVTYPAITISVARVVHDENYDGRTTYYDYNPETGTWTLKTSVENNWVYMFSRKDTTGQGVYKVKGSVATYDDLPTEDQQIGDVWNVLDTGSNYVWTEDGWDKLSETVDLSDYYTKGETQDYVSGIIDNTLAQIADTYYNKTEVNTYLLDINSSISALDNRVTSLETSVGNISSSINTITNSISNLSDRVGTLETASSTYSNRITKNEQDIVNIQSNITNISNAVTVLGNDISNVATDLDTNYYDKQEVDSLIQHIGEALPDQTGHAGEFLTTDGTDASWTSINTAALPDQTGHNGHQLYTNGTDAYWDEPIPSVIWKIWN